MIGPEGVNAVQTMKRCYERFQVEYPDTWQKILATFNKLEPGNNGGETVRHRQALFFCLAKHHCHAVRKVSCHIAIECNRPLSSSQEWQKLIASRL